MIKNEKFHKNYYDKLDYIRVYAKNFIPKNITDTQVKTINKKFYENLSHDERDWCQEEAQKCESFHYSITKFMNAIEGIFQFFNKLKY